MTQTRRWKKRAMYRIGIVIIVGVFCWVFAEAQESDRVFIPHTPLTKQELDEHKAELINEHGWSQATAEEFVRGADIQHYRFTEGDFRRAFADLSPDDQQATMCGNSMMGGATRLVYLSPASENTVAVKTSRCRPVEGGWSCSALSKNVRYFFESPEHNFTLDDGLSYVEASELLAIFRDHGIADLPDWYQRQRFGYLDVTNIGKSDAFACTPAGRLFSGTTRLTTS